MIHAPSLASFRITALVGRAVLTVAALYAAVGLVVSSDADHDQFADGALHTLLLVGAGAAPLATIVCFSTINRSSLADRERRACMIGSTLASLMLLPLLRLAF